MLEIMWEWLQSNGWQAFSKTLSDSLEIAVKLGCKKQDLSTFYTGCLPYVVTFDDMKARHTSNTSNVPQLDVRRIEVFPKQNSGKTIVTRQMQHG